MLDPDVVIDAVVASLRSIPELVAELGGPAIPATSSIIGHYFYGGDENALMRALAQMRSPSIIVCYLDIVGGNFDGMTMFKHRLQIHYRARNKSANNGAASAQHLCWMSLNLPVSVPELAPNIRYVELVNSNLMLVETPSMLRVNDELGQDFIYAPMVFTEKGDIGPDGVDFLCLGAGQVVER